MDATPTERTPGVGAQADWEPPAQSERGCSKTVNSTGLFAEMVNGKSTSPPTEKLYSHLISKYLHLAEYP